MNADFIVSMGVFTDEDENGEPIITDALFGLEMIGEVIYNVDVQIGIEVRYVTKICEEYDSCHVVVVLGSTLFVLQLLSLLVTFAVVASTVFLVVLIDTTFDKIVDMKRAVKVFIKFLSFSLFPLCSREYTVKKWTLLRPVQIGPTICIRIKFVCIPCAFFLEADANAVVKVVVSPGCRLYTFFA